MQNTIKHTDNQIVWLIKPADFSSAILSKKVFDWILQLRTVIWHGEKFIKSSTFCLFPKMFLIWNKDERT